MAAHRLFRQESLGRAATVAVRVIEFRSQEGRVKRLGAIIFVKLFGLKGAGNLGIVASRQVDQEE